jgi:serine/threonine-protein kinase
MASNPRVFGLLEEMLDSGKTPDEVCRDCPELLPEVRQRWQQFRIIDAEVEALLPEKGTPPHADAITAVPDSAGLPQVPGYELEAVLGRGGMGVVYKARHLALKRNVALKMLAGGHSLPAERARFKAEAEAVARLQHPNIVQIHEIGESAGLPFFALEYVEGGSLAKRLAGQVLPPRDAARLVAALAEAMHLAHSRNLVHRDLKPANVLLTGRAGTPIGECQPKVTDFGLVRQLDADSGQTFVGVVLGTPSYMAPEQAEGRAHAAGPAADVYALGAILYECLTGRPPFQGTTRLDTLEQVRTREPAAPSTLNRQTPRDLETICLKCLRKQPEQRYSSARELADDLGRFVRGEPVAARPVGVAERVRKWVRRRPAAAALLAAVVLLAAVGGVGAWLLYQQRITAQARQVQTDLEVRRVLGRARGLLTEGWKTHNLATLTEAGVEGSRAEDVARSGGASAAVRREVEAFQELASGRLERAKKNRTLLAALLDASVPREPDAYLRDEAGHLLAQPSVEEQFATAFRNWGLDVDGTAEAAVVQRLRQEPDVVVQELIAGLDNWMIKRRSGGRPEEEWRRLYRIAEQLDPSDRNRHLRALLVGESPLRAESVTRLVVAPSRWLALWELARGNAWRQLQELRREINPRTAPALTVLLLAQASYAVGDVVGEEQVLRQAVTTRPNEVVLLNAMGQLLEFQVPPRLWEAIGYYRATRVQHPHLGIALSRALARAGQVAEAEQVLQEAVRHQSDNPALYVALGIALYDQARHDEAETAFRKAIDLKADYAEWWNDLGVALIAQRKYADAEAAFRKAINLKPNLVEPNGNLGIALIGQDKHADAEAAFRKVIGLVPDSAPAYFDLSYALIGQGQEDAAEAALRKAIALKPDYAKAYYNLGNTLSQRKKYADAEAAFRTATELKPDYTKAHFNLGNSLFQQNKYAKAEAAFRTAIDLKADYAEAYNNLGFALMRQRKQVQAERAFRTATKLKPDYADAYYNLGNVLDMQYDHAKAEAAFRKAIDLKPDFADAHNNLGMALMQQKNYGEAEAAFRKAIDLKPDRALAQINLGLALMHQAQFHEAIASLNKASDLLRVTDARLEKARQQCQRYVTLDARLPAILVGTEKPANAAEQLELAQLCIFKKYHTAAACFYRDAFTAEPSLAEAVPAGTRYNAACAAALAGCGLGKDADTLDDKQRAHWRLQALDWLRQDLTWWSKALDKGNAQTNAQVRQVMRPWQADGDLAGVRAKDALARLPEEERIQWERLWSDVDALHRRAGEPE